MYSRNTYACVLLADRKIWLWPVFRGAQQRLAGKIKRRANLAGFQDIADAVLKPGAIPVQLIFERLLKENLLQLFDGLVTEKILFGLRRPPLLRLATFGLRSASLPV